MLKSKKYRNFYETSNVTAKQNAEVSSLTNKIN